MSKEYMSCADTAKLIRKVLKATFPGQKFSVKSKTYSGGASIHIDWFDGPTTKQVDEIINVYKGAGFDCMIDLKYYKSAWLMPNGDVKIAHSQGTEGSTGTVPAIQTKQPKGAKEVHFGADHIFCSREYQPETLQKIANEVVKELEQYANVNVPDFQIEVSDYDGHGYIHTENWIPVYPNGQDNIRDLIMGKIQDIDFSQELEAKTNKPANSSRRQSKDHR